MLNIKEIAPKLTQKLSIAINDDEAVEFAEALIAEFAKQNEPVAWMCSDVALIQAGYSKFSNRCEGAWSIPVFTFPPTAEQIANETAEAIAKMLDDAEVEETHYCMNTYEEGKKFKFDMVEAIRNGAWKEFKK